MNRTVVIVGVALLAAHAFAGTSGVANPVSKAHQPGTGDSSLSAKIAEFNVDVVTKLDAMTTTGGVPAANVAAGAVVATVYQPVGKMITEGTTSRTCTSADYGCWIMTTNNAAVAIELPANAATSGSWIGFMSGDGASDSHAPTISAATADTLVTHNDSAADSITYGASHRIGYRVLFVSDGTKWHAFNRCINTMTVATN